MIAMTRKISQSTIRQPKARREQGSWTAEKPGRSQRLMLEVWESLDAEAVPRFYNRDVVGHHRKQQLNYEDVVHRLVADKPRYANPTYDIRDIVAEVDKFAIRFLFVATGPSNRFLRRRTISII